MTDIPVFYATDDGVFATPEDAAMLDAYTSEAGAPLVEVERIAPSLPSVDFARAPTSAAGVSPCSNAGLAAKH